MQPGSHGTDRAALEGGDLFITLAFEVAEHDDLAVSQRQRGDGLAEAGGFLFALHVERERGAGGRGIVQFEPATVATLPALEQLPGDASEEGARSEEHTSELQSH